jgi:hypothetical protein
LTNNEAVLKKLEVHVNVYTNQSWTVDLSASGDNLIIQTTDYHAGPLKLPFAAIASAVKAIASQKANDKRIAPADLIEIRRQGQIILTISKKDKSLFINTTDSTDFPLKLTRKELYAIGKSMNKRVKKSGE